MPAISQTAPAAPTAAGSHPQLSPHDQGQIQADSSPTTLQAAPAVVDSTSHVDGHALLRRFLGPVPENVLHTKEVQEKRERLRELRRKTMGRLRGLEEEARELGDRHTRRKLGTVGVKTMAQTIRVRRKGRHGEEVEEELDLADGFSGSEESESEGYHRYLHRRRKNWRKEEWVGDSFDIGREFVSKGKRVASPAPSLDTSRDQPESSKTAGRRPSYRTNSTQETFTTARTQLSSGTTGARASGSTLDDHTTDENARGYAPPEAPPPGSSNASLVPEYSQTSSHQPLLPDSGDDSHAGPSKRNSPANTLDRNTQDSIKKRLKSAMRRPSALASRSELESKGSDSQKRTKKGLNKSKSVQFPVDPVQPAILQDAEDLTRNRKGNKAPADPEDVLAREGDEAAGTSHAAVEEALEESEYAEDEPVLVGEIIMRDRVLVRIGHHRDENISLFDEAKQRRNPCFRMDPAEEYIAIWRKGRVEFYQDWRNAITERLHGYKRLCFVVPLRPSMSSLSVFNLTDMTLALAVSVEKLRENADIVMKSKTTKIGGMMKDQIKNSKQFDLLKLGRTGTQVFIMNFGERSRALDWYWELWRELGGELPQRLDVDVPSLFTSVRLVVPEDEEVGGAKTRQILNTQQTIETCWDMVSEMADVQDLLRQRKNKGELNVRLAWKGSDGSLEWISSQTTVQGKQRDWAVLAGVARATSERHPQVLQLRPARHRPRNLRLETGSTLEEPSAIEGYLIRHKSATSPKENVYVSSHDGCLYMASASQAHPPIKPNKEGSTPSDLFPEVYSTFQEQEQRRLASFIEHCTGCVDLRDILSANFGAEHDHLADEVDRDQGIDPGVRDGKKSERTFELDMEQDGVMRLEARSPEIAQEWVERLNEMVEYWKRRHRIDARLQTDAAAMHAQNDVFAGSELNNESDEVLADVWDWCVIEGCRPITIAGKLFFKRGKWDRFRARYVVLTQGCLVFFKVKSKASYHLRHHRWPLFGAYIYSGMLAQNELREALHNNALSTTTRLYPDGLQSADSLEDTVFCVRMSAPRTAWGRTRTQPWEMDEDTSFLPPPLSKKPPALLIFRARSKFERDRWVWAINAEMERQVRAHTTQEEKLRQVGKVPERM